MSKWMLVGTNSLESYNGSKEEREKRNTALFKWGIKNQRMKIDKPKKIFKKEDIPE